MTRNEISDKELKEKLTDKEYRVLREKGTEPRFSSELIELEEDGVFHCKACGEKLFTSEEKFNSSSGWPSFYDGLKDNLGFREDDSHGMSRTEVYCKSCGSHLGHVFDDGPEDKTGKRYCINGLALDFEEQ